MISRNKRLQAQIRGKNNRKKEGILEGVLAKRRHIMQASSIQPNQPLHLIWKIKSQLLLLLHSNLHLILHLYIFDKWASYIDSKLPQQSSLKSKNQGKNQSYKKNLNLYLNFKNKSNLILKGHMNFINDKTKH